VTCRKTIRSCYCSPPDATCPDNCATSLHRSPCPVAECDSNAALHRWISLPIPVSADSISSTTSVGLSHSRSLLFYARRIQRPLIAVRCRRVYFWFSYTRKHGLVYDRINFITQNFTNSLILQRCSNVFQYFCLRQFINIPLIVLLP